MKWLSFGIFIANAEEDSQKTIDFIDSTIFGTYSMQHNYITYQPKNVDAAVLFWDKIDVDDNFNIYANILKIQNEIVNSKAFFTELSIEKETKSISMVKFLVTVFGSGIVSGFLAILINNSLGNYP